MNVRFDYRERVVLVTGAASGIGRRAAEAFADAGASVVVADVDATRGEEVATAIRGAGQRADFLAMDVGDAGSVERGVDWIVGRHGRLDVAFNNAGVGGAAGPLADVPIDDWERMIRLDLVSVYYCMRAEIRAMIATGGGAIINNASVMGLMGGYKMSAYMSAKHGVIGMTKAAAMDYAAQGVRINAVAPGTIETPLTAGMPLAMRARLDDATPLLRTGSVDEVAQSVMWLASDAASYVIGHTLPVDGGQALGGSGTRFDLGGYDA